MTTLILVTIGILLAGAAALMTVWYGGDAFDSGDAKAKADQLMNSGTNVRQAANLYMVNHGKLPADATALAERAVKQMPTLHGIGTTQNAWMELRSDNYRVAKAYAVTGIRDDVCRIVNENAIGAKRKNAILERPEGLTGCFRQNGGNTYYAMLSAAAPRAAASAAAVQCASPPTSARTSEEGYWQACYITKIFEDMRNMALALGNKQVDFITSGNPMVKGVVESVRYNPGGGWNPSTRFERRRHLAIDINVDGGSYFCRQWNAMPKPFEASPCDSYYGNHVKIFF